MNNVPENCFVTQFTHAVYRTHTSFMNTCVTLALLLIRIPVVGMDSGMMQQGQQLQQQMIGGGNIPMSSGNLGMAGGTMTMANGKDCSFILN
jgi:hypothetical protein